MTVSFPVAAFVAVWLLAAMAIAWVTYQRRLVEGPGPERAFVLAGTLLIGIAPLMWLIAREASGSVSFFGGGIHIVAGLLLFAAAWRARRSRQSGGGSIINFPEKSAWLVLGALIIVYGSFILRSWDSPADVAAGAFLQSVGVFIAVMIIGHAIIALFHAPIEEVDNAPDERDRRISLLSSRNAYYLLFAGFWSLPVMVLVELPLSQLLIGWFTVLMISELLYYSSVLFYYRFGNA